MPKKRGRASTKKTAKKSKARSRLPEGHETHEVHQYAAIAFMMIGAFSFIGGLIFLSQDNWVTFFISAALVILCLDNAVLSIKNHTKTKPHKRPGIENIHAFSANLFLLLAISGGVLAFTFLFIESWLLMFLSFLVVVVGFDNMHVAMKNHKAQA